MAVRASADTSGDAVFSSRRTCSAASRILGESQAIRELRTAVEMAAHRSATVLLEGQTGTGKEVTAREIHRLSRRAERSFVPVDCTVFTNELMESQLFGHVKGAFTGAVNAAMGFMRCAEGGTLLLDEIGELPLTAQAKLLRCIQERAVVPLGATEPISVDVRIIAATHRDLARMVRDGTFRQDLYYRLNVVRLTIPPLAERREDIVLLARHFLEEIAYSYEEPIKVLSAAVEEMLGELPWPGNIRELRNVIERAFLFCGDRTVDLHHLPHEIRDLRRVPPVSEPASCSGEPDTSIPRLADAERLLIARALKATGGNQSGAARLLDVERHRLRRIITRHGLEHLLITRPR